MKLTLLSEDQDIVHLQGEGELGDTELSGDAEPMGPLLASRGGFGRKVLLNLESTTIMYTPGMSWLLSCNKKFNQGGGKLVIHSVPPLVEESLKFTRLHRVLHLAPDAASARALALEEKK